MASALLASSRDDPFWGEPKPYMSKKPRNPNPNPNPNSMLASAPFLDRGENPSSSGHGETQRPQLSKKRDFAKGLENSYVTFDIGGYSRRELQQLKRRLISELEQVRSLCSRINSGDDAQPSRSACLSTTGHGGGGGGGREVSSAPAGSLPGASEAMMKKCVQILTKLMKHRHGWVFNRPVDVMGLGLHDYYQIVKRPMDLGTVKSRLVGKGGSSYSSPSEFAADVRLTFNNALSYNPEGHDVHKMAGQLLNLFEKLFADACRAQSEEDRAQATSPPAVSARPLPPSAPPARPISPPTQPAALAATARAGVGKQPKPKAKEANKREMSFEEKKKLSHGLQSLPEEKMAQVLLIVQRRNPDPALHGDEIELDFETLDTETLWELDRFVANCKKTMSKVKRQEAVSAVGAPPPEMAAANSPAKSAAAVGPGKAAGSGGGGEVGGGEEEVDIGEEMPSAQFSPVEIDKDSGNRSESSGSSSSSGSDSSSSTDSDSRSSGDSGDSHADEAQSPAVG